MAHRAVKIDPLSTLAEYNYSYVLFMMRRFGEAVPHLQRAIELENAQDTLAYVIVAFTYERLGRVEDAIRLLDRPEFRGSTWMAYAYAVAGRRTEAGRLVHDLSKLIVHPIGTDWVWPIWRSGTGTEGSNGSMTPSMRGNCRLPGPKCRRISMVFAPIRGSSRWCIG